MGNPLDGTAGTAPAAGTVWTRKAITDQNGVSATFPKNFVSATDGSLERPWFRGVWDKLYQYYTVIGCEYEVTIMNPNTFENHGMVAWTLETDGVNSSVVTRPTMDLFELMGQKNIRYEPCWATNSEGHSNMTVIQGKYKPGQAKRSITNDGDVKTWTAVASTPTFREYLQLLFYQHPFTQQQATGAISTKLNVQVRLKYIVQFKDLNENAGMPNSETGNSTILTLPTDALPIYNQA